MKEWTYWQTSLTRQTSKSFYTVTMTKTKEITYPYATVTLNENTGEIQAFAIIKDRPTYPSDYLNNKEKRADLDKARKEAKAAADKWMVELLGKNAANYVADEVNFGGSSSPYTTVAHLGYKAKHQNPNAPLDLISIQIDASGALVTFIHY